MTAFPCSGCPDCGVPNYHSDALFQESASTTFAKVSCGDCLYGKCPLFGSECRASAMYGEGSSWKAYEATDRCYIGGLHDQALPPSHTQVASVHQAQQHDVFDPNYAPSFRLQFGCQTKVTGLFKTQLADGIVGMDNIHSSFWRQLQRSHVLSSSSSQDFSFSLCFRRSPVIDRNGTSAGALTLGGTDPRLHSTPMVYASLSFFTHFYVVRIRNIYWQRSGDRAVHSLDLADDQMNRGRVIVDSGTTDSFLSSAIFPSLERVYEQVMGSPLSLGVLKMTAEELSQQPTLLLQLVGDTKRNRQVLLDNGDAAVLRLAQDIDPQHPYDILVAVPPENYFEYDKRHDGYVFRIKSRGRPGSVLGANTIMGHDVLIHPHDKIIGWADSPCNYDALAAPFPTPPPAVRVELVEVESDLNESSWQDACEETCQMGLSFSLLVVLLVGMVRLQQYRRERRTAEPVYEPANVSEDDAIELQELPQYIDDDDADDLVEETSGRLT